MINAGMVFCDRHYGGINYPIGGVGRIPEAMAEGLREHDSFLVYKANVRTCLRSLVLAGAFISLQPLLKAKSAVEEELQASNQRSNVVS